MKIKFIHMMPQNSTIFNGSIIEMLNDNPNFDHLFIVENAKIKELYPYDNVIHRPDIFTNKLNCLNEYFQQCEFLIMHSLYLDVFEILKLDVDILRKMIWVVWGHDLYLTQSSSCSIKACIKRYIKKKSDRKIAQNIQGIGVGFKYDAFEVISRFDKTIPVYMMPYGIGVEESFITQLPTEEKSKTTKIMIGHSSYAFLDHIKVLKKLSKFKDENMQVYLVLSYGDMEYAARVETYARDLFKDKAIVMKDMMSTNEYIHFINTIDIAIFNHLHQSALGNLIMLLFLKKRLFLAREGVLAKSFLLENIDFSYTEDIDTMSFDEFVNSEVEYENGKDFAFNSFINYAQRKQKWLRALREINTYER